MKYIVAVCVLWSQVAYAAPIVLYTDRDAFSLAGDYQAYGDFDVNELNPAASTAGWSSGGLRFMDDMGRMGFGGGALSFFGGNGGPAQIDVTEPISSLGFDVVMSSHSFDFLESISVPLYMDITTGKGERMTFSAMAGGFLGVILDDDTIASVHINNIRQDFGNAWPSTDVAIDNISTRAAQVSPVFFSSRAVNPVSVPEPPTALLFALPMIGAFLFTAFAGRTALGKP